MFEGHHGCVTSIATFGDGKRLVSGSLNNNVRIWDIFSGAQFKNLEGHAGAIMVLLILDLNIFLFFI
jgi:WD40 repeat protein